VFSASHTSSKYQRYIVLSNSTPEIILNPCYHVDDENAFSDMLFYNIIIKATRG